MPIPRRSLLALIASLPVLAALGLAACHREPAKPPSSLTVFAAASTTDVMHKVADAFRRAKGVDVRFNVDASSNLARQIKAGASADMFISADQKWMDDVAASGAIQPATRQDLLASHLVLVAPTDSPLQLTATREFNFGTTAAAIRKLAMADPAHVPAGRYGRQSLEWLGWWPSAEGRVVTAPDVRAALRLVELKEADAGIVYSTDAKSSTKVKVIATFPEESHEPIRYPVALTTHASPRAVEFLEFLRSPEAISVFQGAGFAVVPPPGAP
jgi:molybdate transport system substrate-binding protein